jgi:1-acyl-sn-glycerol-3-phosphate acyltransferase
MIRDLFNSTNFVFKGHAEENERVYKALKARYETNKDPWGLNPEKSKTTLKYVTPLYRDYFKTRVFGAEHVENKPYIVVSNHTGQIPFDGMIVTCAFLLDIVPPRVLRAMMERFVTSIPFFSAFVTQNGGVLGDRSNCNELLTRGESVLVFPEGVKGISKNTNKYYEVQNFTKGFYRLALKNNVEILPVAVVGAEEFYPLVYHPKKIAKMAGLPALPLSPGLLAGPLGMLPLPSPVDLHIGKPISVSEFINAKLTDDDIQTEVNKVQNTVNELIQAGLPKRRPFWAQKIVSKIKDNL